MVKVHSSGNKTRGQRFLGAVGALMIASCLGAGLELLDLLQSTHHRSGIYGAEPTTGISEKHLAAKPESAAAKPQPAVPKVPLTAQEPRLASEEPQPVQDRTPLEGTQPLELEGDIAFTMIDGIDRFLLRKIDQAAEKRETFWRRDYSSPEAYEKSLEPNRQRLAHILGVRDERAKVDGFELVATTQRSALVGQGPGYQVLAVRWPAFGDVWGEGLLVVPEGRQPVADVVAIPDGDLVPEQLVGLLDGVVAECQYARRLAESGCRVVVPTLISRQMSHRGVEGRRGALLTHREYLYRSAYELGRHLIGYEVQKVLAAVDALLKEPGPAQRKVGLIGWGEGGLLALYAAALDTRIDAVCVSGYFTDRRTVWQEPIDRNVFGLLEQFGDAELAAMVAPRAVIIEAAKAPEVQLPSQGGAPGRLTTPSIETVRQEWHRTLKLIEPLQPKPTFQLVESGRGSGPYGSAAALEAFLQALQPGTQLPPQAQPPKRLVSGFDTDGRLARQIQQLDRHNQHLLAESPYVRQKFMAKLDFSSLEAYERSAAEYRRFFYEEVIGRFDDPLLPPNPRTRKAYQTSSWIGYEVVLDVWTDVIAYGLLLVPKDIKPGQRRPVVVCQHGLEGRPQHLLGKEGYAAYKAFANALAERGFVVFAPQNLYLGQDRFRTLQRKANPIKKTLFSIITPQHQQILNWLKSLPFVDGSRIGFYGLSYGGKTAMRVPAILTDYCLSICSADFNEWVWKNASTRSPYSYVWTGEYEIFEFDLGSTFNYAEMAALIAPRPFMVERGHFDVVAPDETVAYEYAKVRHLYAARLHLPERTQIEWFVGPHTIHGVGTFEFLHRWLNWPKPTH
ncbi:MAG: dienelactone hydrolase family protein [Thermoguttaceae bacterium]|nr:dienelactone hydrolase family protein [Thermoguttaceae bacterium]MDW8038216.1 dienelactone hydrolase family protein [Thermoguttaceae bacterium]